MKRFLNWFCREEIREGIVGDLEELYNRRKQKLGTRRANWLYLWNVVRFLQPFAIKKISTNSNFNIMFRNYFKIGWRNLIKHKSYSAINILGLSAGFGATLLLSLIINYENSYDKFHDNHDRIYRVGTRYSEGRVSDLIVTPQIPLMKEEYPDIVKSTRFYDGWSILRHGETYMQSSYHVVDPDFATMFNFKVIKGDLKSALSTQDKIVLTESFARKLFGDKDPMGETVDIVDEDLHFIVAAIVEDPPKNSTLKFEALIPWLNAPSWLDIDQAGNWYNTFMTGYVQIGKMADPGELEKKLKAFVQNHFLEERKASHEIMLLPLPGEHYRSTNNKRIIGILAIIAGAILFISCLNFMNLSVSQLLGRTKEIGVRKVMGSLRVQLIYQFIIEGLIVSSIAILTGILIVSLCLPFVNNYFEFDIHIRFLENQNILFYLMAISLLTIVICSFWPSVALSGLKPVSSMKGVISKNKSGGYFRRGLVVLQFSVSAILIVGTLVIWSQIQFMKNRDLKFSGDHVVATLSWPDIFKDPEKAKRGLRTMRDQLKNEMAIQSVTLTECIPGEYNENYNTFNSVDSSEIKSLSLRQLTVDHKFFETFKMNILHGRNFSLDIASDKDAVIINESAMKQFGWEDIVGKQLRGGGSNKSLHVIGVVEDYYYQSLKRSIQPVIHFYNPDVTMRIAVRLNPDRLQEGLALFKEKWNQLDPHEPLDYFFVDEAFNELYIEQQRLGTTSSLFSLIAIVIAGLGLFSITAYTIRLRKKEIGIRKVLGASTLNIISKLSTNFGMLVVVAFLIACPAIYFLADAFLQDFTYRIPLSPWIFIGGGFLILSGAMLIVWFQSAVAARINPTECLKEE